MADMLKRQDREGGRTRHWRANLKRLQRELLQLEEDEQVLDSVFPQVWGEAVPCNIHHASHSKPCDGRVWLDPALLAVSPCLKKDVVF